MTGRSIHVAVSLLALAGLALACARIVAGHVEPVALGDLAAGYMRLSPEELTVPNVVTGILLAYRSFDTLGEVAVLFMVAASLGPLLQPMDGAPAPRPVRPMPPASEIVESGHHLLMPFIATFGAYVILNGHLSAGGGFQGGAIVASGVGLFMIVRVGTPVDTRALSVGESMAGVLFVAIGALGLVLGGGFLDPRILPGGELGRFVSGGTIPIVSALLGIKVAAELSVVLQRFRS